MVDLALPIVFINLGGEMLYILDQRLHAQKIPADKAFKVMHDISSMMFSRQFLMELLQPQPMYTKTAMRMVFDKLAHASIMRLNSASMDKLYDLMTMAVKYQVVQCPRPSDLMLVTLNHLDSAVNFLQRNSDASEVLSQAMSTLVQSYSRLSRGQWQCIRSAVLNFFQDVHIRVSIFLKDRVQTQTGRFYLPKDGELPFGFVAPGKIRFHLSEGKTKDDSFSSNGCYTVCKKEGFMGVKGDRVTKLGLNMYKESKPIETQTVVSSKTLIRSADLDTNVKNPNAMAQLDLLSQLISSKGGSRSSKSSSQSSSQFKLSLYQTEEEEKTAEVKREIVVVGDRGTNVIVIDAKKKNMNDELIRIIGDMSLDRGRSSNRYARDDDDDDEDDLLDLMDRA